MSDHQAKIDSLMESLTNTAIGIPMDWSTNLQITAIFTVVSIARQYVLRRLFNGRSPWSALKAIL